MERGVFLQRQQGGLKEWPGLQMILNGARIGGSWANWYEAHFKCGGFNSKTATACRRVDAKFEQYETSINPDERKKLAEEVQRYLGELFFFCAFLPHAFVNAIGPRIAVPWQMSSRRLPQPFPGKTSSCGIAASGTTVRRRGERGRKDAAVYRVTYPIALHPVYPEHDDLHDCAPHRRPGPTDGRTRCPP